MSTIRVIESKAVHYSNLGRYFFATLEAGKHSMSVSIAPDHLQIIVHNASNRAWRGTGKRFESLAAALGAYRTADIRAMIQTAADLSAADVAAQHEASAAKIGGASYRETCPQRTVTAVHHGIGTWLPVTLDCGHVEQINFTVSEGSQLGCTQCANTTMGEQS